MSKALITEAYLTDIADAIRAKNGSSDTYTPPQMAAAIANIPTGGDVDVEALSVTQNGTHTAPTGKAYSPVTVNVQPTLQSKTATQNGTVTPDTGYDGLSSVTVNVSGGIKSGTDIPTTSEISNHEMYVQTTLYADRDVDVSVKPSNTIMPESATAGQNANSALAAFSRTDTSGYWTTSNKNYSNMWIAAVYDTPTVCNFLTVCPRTYSSNRQINNIYVDVSNDGTTWKTLCKFTGGNDITPDYWAVCPFDNTTAYRWYRLRTDTNAAGTVNGSITFTIYGVGFGYDSSLTANGYAIPVAVYQNVNGSIIQQL